VTGAVYADTTMFENLGKGNGLASGVCSVRKNLVKKEMVNIFFLTQCLLMGVPFFCLIGYQIISVENKMHMENKTITFNNL
jgi:hypothetical protein